MQHTQTLRIRAASGKASFLSTSKQRDANPKLGSRDGTRQGIQPELSVALGATATCGPTDHPTQARLPEHLLQGKFKSLVILLTDEELSKAALEMPYKGLKPMGREGEDRSVSPGHPHPPSTKNPLSL